MASQKRNFEPSSGWEEDVDHQNNNRDIINVANSKVSLDAVLKKYSVQLESNYGSSGGWSFRGSCPFPDHSDNSPSFGYNPTIGRFNCFGCHRGGRAVEFIAHMDGRSRISVARDLVQYNSDENVSFNSFDFEKLQEMLFEFADIVRKFKGYHGSKVAEKYAEAVTWNLDVYLRKNAIVGAIILEDLEARIMKLKLQLEAFGDPD